MQVRLGVDFWFLFILPKCATCRDVIGWNLLRDDVKYEFEFVMILLSQVPSSFVSDVFCNRTIESHVRGAIEHPQ